MTTNDRKFLIFSLQGLLYALDLTQVAEVNDPPQMWAIPLAPPCFSGALNYNGDIVAVMNLALFLGLPETGNGKLGKIVLLRQEVASLAFLVETVVRIVSEAEVSFGPAPDKSFAAATLVLTDGEAIQLDPDALVLEAELRMQKGR